MGVAFRAREQARNSTSVSPACPWALDKEGLQKSGQSPVGCQQEVRPHCCPQLYEGNKVCHVDQEVSEIAKQSLPVRPGVLVLPIAGVGERAEGGAVRQDLPVLETLCLSRQQRVPS